MNRILLADDNCALHSALRLMLETRFATPQIDEVYDMEQALALAETTQPDCIVLDWELPGLPAHERIKALRACVPGMLVIVTSANPDAKLAALDEKADAYIDKGDAPLEIIKAFKCLCEKREKE